MPTSAGALYVAVVVTVLIAVSIIIVELVYVLRYRCRFRLHTAASSSAAPWDVEQAADSPAWSGAAGGHSAGTPSRSPESKDLQFIWRQLEIGGTHHQPHSPLMTLQTASSAPAMASPGLEVGFGASPPLAPMSRQLLVQQRLHQLSWSPDFNHHHPQSRSPLKASATAMASPGSEAFGASPPLAPMSRHLLIHPEPDTLDTPKRGAADEKEAAAGNKVVVSRFREKYASKFLSGDTRDDYEEGTGKLGHVQSKEGERTMRREREDLAAPPTSTADATGALAKRKLAAAARDEEEEEESDAFYTPPDSPRVVKVFPRHELHHTPKVTAAVC